MFKFLFSSDDVLFNTYGVIRINLKDISRGNIYRPFLDKVYKFNYEDILECTPFGGILYNNGLHFLSSIVAVIELKILGINFYEYLRHDLIDCENVI